MTVRTAHPFYDVMSKLLEENRPGLTATFLHEVDLSEVEQIRRQSPKGSRPSYTAFVAKAVALALREFPYANVRMMESIWPFARTKLQAFSTCDLAIACERDVVGADAVAFVDVLRDSDQLSLQEMTEWLRALHASDETNNPQWKGLVDAVTKLPRWLARLVVSLPRFSAYFWSKWRGGSVLISSPAKYGVDAIVATWAAPLGVSFGVVRERPMVRDGQVVARPSFVLTLNFDRRVIAGANGARFFAGIVRNLEHAKTAMAAFLPQPAVSAAAAPAPLAEVG